MVEIFDGKMWFKSRGSFFSGYEKFSFAALLQWLRLRETAVVGFGHFLEQREINRKTLKKINGLAVR